MNSSPARNAAAANGPSSTGQITLRTRIFLICALLVAVCLLVTAIGWFGQQRLLSSFEDFEQTELVGQRQLEIDRTVQELRVSAERFLNTGAESQYRRANAVADRLLARLEETKTRSTNSDLTSLATELEGHLTTFVSQLKLAAEERNLRTTLVEEVLPIAAKRVLNQLDNVRDVHSGQDGLTGKLNRIERDFSEGRSGLYEYLARPQYSSYQTMLRSFAAVQDVVSEIMLDDSTSETLHSDMQKLADAITEFQERGQRTFQATRGYLYYANVVMAGEISEFVYYSNQIKESIELQLEANVQKRAQTIRDIRVTTLVVSMLAILIAGLLGLQLSYAIVPPLSALTETFRSLASGETVTAIPGTDRSDEIGRMANAASVFSDRNRETRELLDRANALTEQLAEQTAELQETNAELDNFAYVASHDLKSPLRGIDHLASWIEEDSGDVLSEESLSHLRQMRERVSRMNLLLDDLLEYSRVGRTGQQPEPVDLNELLASLIQVVDNSNGVKISLPQGLPTIETDRAPLQQVILNLVTNAIKYNDKGTGGTVELSFRELPDAYEFGVSDNGIGIAPTHHERIFQMYQRVAPEKAEGSGMGLAIVRKQVENYGGEITVKSGVGEGAAFFFTWPKRQS